MPQPTTEELLARIETLEGRQRTQTRRRSARMALSVVALAALLAVPIGVFASHSFTDVPDLNTFHTQIGRVKGAGITAGCTATTYCPDANVTRGQMAAFLARTGGRLSSDGISTLGDMVAISNDASLPTVLATVTIKAGDVTGGYANVQVTGSMTILTTSATGLPSYVSGYLRVAGTNGQLSRWIGAQVDSLADGFGIDTAGFVTSVTVPTGVSKTYEFVAHRGSGTGTFDGMATLTALYVPFDGDGTNASPVVAPAPASKPGPLVGPVSK